MYTLLIVDDEPHIRTGLKHIIEWEIYGIEIIGAAEDGEKAYSLIQSEHPNLVLVDITMPNMSGLELIERCSQMESVPKFIILTGYNDFKYVQKALKLGASDYLLKPVDQNELANAVSSCVKLLDNLREHRQIFCESLPALRNDILLRLLNNQIDVLEFQKKSAAINIFLKNGSMYIGVFAAFADKNNDSFSLIQFMDFCGQTISALCPCYIVSDNGQNLVVIFQNEMQLSEAACRDIMLSCSNELSGKLSRTVIFVLGREVCNIRDLHLSYNDCISQLEKKLILGEHTLEQLPMANGGLTIDYSDFLICLASKDPDKTISYLHTCCQQFLIYENNENFLKYYLIDLTTYVLRYRYTNSYFGPEAENKKKTAFSIISNTDSIQKLIDKLSHFFLTLQEDPLMDFAKSECSPLVQKALKKVRENYADANLSLKTLAADMQVNPAYLGREFNIATGEYFNDYLNRIRISEAIRLLNTTSLKATKIAESVGFTNASYFFTIFKKITGQSPNDYRSLQTVR